MFYSKNAEGYYQAKGGMEDSTTLHIKLAQEANLEELHNMMAEGESEIACACYQEGIEYVMRNARYGASLYNAAFTELQTRQKEESADNA